MDTRLGCINIYSLYMRGGWRAVRQEAFVRVCVRARTRASERVHAALRLC